MGPNYGLMILAPTTCQNTSRTFASARPPSAAELSSPTTCLHPNPEPEQLLPLGWTTTRRRCSVQVQLAAGLDPASAQYLHSDAGDTWSRWQPADCTGDPGTTDPQIITADRVAFGQDSTTPDRNRIEFQVSGSLSPTYNVAMDAAPPSPPATITGDRPLSTWTNDATAAMSWSGAADAASGVKGYSYAWSPTADTTPDATMDSSLPSSATTLPGDGSAWYFHVRAVDKRRQLGHRRPPGPLLPEHHRPHQPHLRRLPSATPPAPGPATTP